MTIIQRTSLRVQVRDELRKRLLLGSLEPGARVNESALAESLGVSQTPVREALLTLEQERFLTSRPGEGFRVVPLRSADVLEGYPILGNLEALALRLGGRVAQDVIEELRRLNGDLRVATQFEDAHRLDNKFHSALLAHTPSQRLLVLVGDLRLQMDRYEYAYFRSHDRLDSSWREHEAILDALEAGDIEQAATGLERNWTEGNEPLVEWLKELES